MSKAQAQSLSDRIEHCRALVHLMNDFHDALQHGQDELAAQIRDELQAQVRADAQPEPVNPFPRRRP